MIVGVIFLGIFFGLSVICSDVVLKRVFVEDVGREGIERRVYSILDLEADGTDV